MQLDGVPQRAQRAPAYSLVLRRRTRAPGSPPPAATAPPRPRDRPAPSAGWRGCPSRPPCWGGRGRGRAPPCRGSRGAASRRRRDRRAACRICPRSLLLVAVSRCSSPNTALRMVERLAGRRLGLGGLALIGQRARQLDQRDRDVLVPRPEHLPAHRDGFAEQRLRLRRLPHLAMQHAEVVEALRQPHVRRAERAAADARPPAAAAAAPCRSVPCARRCGRSARTSRSAAPA